MMQGAQMDTIEGLRSQLRAATVHAQQAAYAAEYSQPAEHVQLTRPNNVQQSLSIGDFVAELGAAAENSSADQRGAPAPSTTPTQETVLQARAVQEQIRRQLNEELRAENEYYLSSLGRAWFIGALIVIAVLVAASVVFDVSADIPQVRLSAARFWASTFSGENPLLWAAVAALLLWCVLVVLSRVQARSGRLTGMLIGADGRFSTSHFQAWIWTLALVWAFVFFIMFGTVGGSEPIGELGVSADYLLLLGGPFAAMVVAKQIDGAKVASGELQKPPSTQTKLTDLVSDDSGRTDLVDMQYLMFNTVTLLVFAISIWSDPTQLPDIPDQLLMLTGAAALGYVARKAVQRNAPIITSITAAGVTGVPTIGEYVRISGANFVPSGAETAEAITQVKVKFGATAVSPTPITDHGHGHGHRSSDTEPIPGSAPPSTDRDGVTDAVITVRIPELPPDGRTERVVDVVVVTGVGAETAAQPLRVFSPILPVDLAPSEVSADGTVTLTMTLRDEKFIKFPARISIGKATFTRFWSSDRMLSVQFSKGAVQGGALEVSCGGAVFTSQL